MITSTGYTRLQIRLHWATVILVALQYLFEDGIAGAWRDATRSGIYAFSTPVILHFATGSLILGLALWRLLLRNEYGAPPAPEGEAPLLVLVSKLTHYGIYGLLVLLPVTGAVAWGLQAAQPGEVHKLMQAALMILIGLHVAAALYHKFILKSGIWSRMTTPVD